LFSDPLHTGKLGEVLIAAIDRSPRDPRIQAMQDAMVDICRTPIWETAKAAIDLGALSPTLTKSTVAAHTLGPIVYTRLFERKTISSDDIERTVDAFLSAFSNAGQSREHSSPQ
jgi:hypothetical protein